MENIQKDSGVKVSFNGELLWVMVESVEGDTIKCFIDQLPKNSKNFNLWRFKKVTVQRADVIKVDNLLVD